MTNPDPQLDKIVFDPLPENPTPREWWELKISIARFTAFTQAFIESESRYIQLTLALLKKEEKGVPFSFDLIDSFHQPARNFVLDKHIALTQAVERLNNWAAAHAATPEPPIP